LQIGSDDAARAFEVIYDRHSRPAYSLAYRILGSRTTAEEAVQEAFLSVWRSRSRYLPERGSVRSWVLAIAHSRSIDVLRRNAVHLQRQAFSADDDFEDRREAFERTDDEVIEREQAGELREALTQLAPSQQKVVELAYFGGSTHRGAARDDQGEDATRAREAARGLTRGGGVMAQDHDRRRDDLAAMRSGRSHPSRSRAWWSTCEFVRTAARSSSS
jgi:RNA polymerase sigma-70 factor, ECF subfamily